MTRGNQAAEKTNAAGKEAAKGRRERGEVRISCQIKEFSITSMRVKRVGGGGGRQNE